MKFYREIPKSSLRTLLKQQFTPQQLELASQELNMLLYSCNSLDELKNKLSSFLASSIRKPSVHHPALKPEAGY